MKYSEEPFTGYRVALYSDHKSMCYPETGKPYLASYEDAVELLHRCLTAHKSRLSFAKFEIVYENHGRKQAFD